VYVYEIKVIKKNDKKLNPLYLRDEIKNALGVIGIEIESIDSHREDNKEEE